MELYTINPNDGFKRSDIIEKFESFIWTDRYSAHGDFKLVTAATPDMLDRLAPDTLIGFDQSDRVMKISTWLHEQKPDGTETLTVSGRSFEWVLSQRPAKHNLFNAPWAIQGTPGRTMMELVSVIFVEGRGVLPEDVIPNFAAEDLTGTGPSYDFLVEPGSVYERVKEIADSFGLGFRVTLVPGSNRLVWSAYKGTDRSYSGGVVFSKGIENLSGVSHLKSHADYKTGAFVVSQFGSALVDADDIGTADDIGFRRNILYVDATDIADPPSEQLHRALIQRGRDALSQHKKVNFYDGVVNPNSVTRYNEHYFMGDIARFVANGEVQLVRVTEHIWSYDTNGFNSYPTLSAIGGV